MIKKLIAIYHILRGWPVGYRLHIKDGGFYVHPHTCIYDCVCEGDGGTGFTIVGEAVG